MSKKNNTTRNLRIRRHVRVRARIKGTPIRPRLCVFRSNRYLWAQLIDDITGRTLVQATDREKQEKANKAGKKKMPIMRAQELGEKVGQYAKEKQIFAFVFDRSGYKYHGRVKAVAEGARKSGIQL